MNVTDATGNGVFVSSAGADGFRVSEAGSSPSFGASTTNNGFEVNGAQGMGLFVGYAGGDGVRITDAGDDGIQIGDGVNVPAFGLFVTGPGTTGNALLPNTANASGQWALFTTDNIEAGNVFLSAQTLVAEIGGDAALAPGDVVAATGMAEAIPGSTVPLVQVRRADAAPANVVGVVHSRMAWTPLPGLEKAGESDMRSVDGPAKPGDYVAITVLGPAQVKLQAGENVQPGQRVTVGPNGAVRTLQTRLLDGMVVGEGAAVVGVAIEPATDGLVWVLVNPQ